MCMLSRNLASGKDTLLVFAELDNHKCMITKLCDWIYGLSVFYGQTCVPP